MGERVNLHACASKGSMMIACRLFGFAILAGSLLFGARWLDRRLMQLHATRASSAAIGPISKLSDSLRSPQFPEPKPDFAVSAANVPAVSTGQIPFLSSPEQVMGRLSRIQDQLTKALGTPVTAMLGLAPEGAEYSAGGIITFDLSLFLRLSEGAAIACAARAIGQDRYGRELAPPFGENSAVRALAERGSELADEFSGWIVGGLGYDLGVGQEFLESLGTSRPETSSATQRLSGPEAIGAFAQGYYEGARYASERTENRQTARGTSEDDSAQPGADGSVRNGE